jgi:hypothetical protein
MNQVHQFRTVAIGLALVAALVPACGDEPSEAQDEPGSVTGRPETTRQTGPPADPDPVDTAPLAGIVDPVVVEAIESGEELAVIVSLDPPTGYGAPDADLGEIKREIARTQDGVLDALDTSDFVVRVRFATVPAFAGRLITEAGMTELATHPDVVSVDPDIGGTGN